MAASPRSMAEANAEGRGMTTMADLAQRHAPANAKAIVVGALRAEAGCHYQAALTAFQQAERQRDAREAAALCDKTAHHLRLAASALRALAENEQELTR